MAAARPEPQVFCRMGVMDESRPQPLRRFPRPALVVVGLTLAACITAVCFRTAIRSRFWASRVISAGGAAERASYLTLLCNAGDGGRWGTSVLLDHADAGIRQQGVIVLHHVRTAWARERLTRLLGDPDAGVTELAALGLALHGDESVIPRLRELYESGPADAGRAACIALGRLATPTAITTLTELAGAPGDVEHAAALVDALDDVGTAEAVPALLKLLADERECNMAARRDQRAQQILRHFGNQSGSLPEMIEGLEHGPAGRTVADRAARVLGRITGISTPYTATMPAVARDAARTAWEAWQRDHGRPAIP
jgi:hypothetical protein